MRPDGIILNQPIGQFLVHDLRVRVKIALSEEFLFKSTIEAFQDSVVLRCPRSGPIVGQVKGVGSLIKVFVKFTVCPSQIVSSLTVNAAVTMSINIV